MMKMIILHVYILYNYYNLLLLTSNVYVYVRGTVNYAHFVCLYTHYAYILVYVQLLCTAEEQERRKRSVLAQECESLL